MQRKEQKLRKNLRSKKGCSPVSNIFTQNNTELIPPSIMEQIGSLNTLDCDSVNRLNFHRGPSHEQNKKEMEIALSHLQGKKVEKRSNNSGIEGYICSQFLPHQNRGDRSIKEEEQIFCDELLDNSRFRKDLDDFILN